MHFHYFFRNLQNINIITQIIIILIIIIITSNKVNNNFRFPATTNFMIVLKILLYV